MKEGTENHVKTKRLKRILKIPLYQAVGLLETMWLLCQSCCDEGHIGKFTDEEIADYLEWDREPSELVRGLAGAGWIDPDPVHRYVVHDWLEECPEFIWDRVRKRRLREQRTGKVEGTQRKIKTYEQIASDNSETVREVAGQVRDTAGSVRLSPPNPTQPNPTQPGQNGQAGQVSVLPESLDPEKPPASTFTGSNPAFEMAWALWPEKRRTGKTNASEAWQTAAKQISVRHAGKVYAAEDWLLMRLRAYVKSPAAASKYCKGIGPWLTGGHYDDPAAAWEHGDSDSKTANGESVRVQLEPPKPKVRNGSAATAIKPASQPASGPAVDVVQDARPGPASSSG